jgi:integrase
MASFTKVGSKWRAQVRQKGAPPLSKNFATKVLATQWARQVEADIDTGRATTAPVRNLTTVISLVDRYINEVGAAKPFGRNKADVLSKIRKYLGSEIAAELTAERVVDYIRADRKISDVTASIDLTYLKGVLKIARALWREPVHPSVVDDAREILKYMGTLNRSIERDRRPTPDELGALREWFRWHSNSLTPDVFDFILASCFRPPSEIIRLRWEDLIHADKTIVIHDRKDPRKKIGNHQTVPLLHGAYDIVLRQPKKSDLIFPVNGNSWSTLFPRACSDLKIEDLRLYDLRHEAISRLVESRKYSIPEMMLVTGHKDPKQLMRYTQLRARDLHR